MIAEKDHHFHCPAIPNQTKYHISHYFGGIFPGKSEYRNRKGDRTGKVSSPLSGFGGYAFFSKIHTAVGHFYRYGPAALTQQDSIAGPMKIVRRIFFFTSSRKIIFSSLIPLDKAGGIHYYFSNF
ncbi:hypothetical protein [Angelakisella massiliensis]|uniref:hypothetical protein n=1 Tax=Angelakisella massiliensis TaxID=1871018 RepID=UPI0023A90D33|nr:hypothetical protein [Angelakisella massiliensis]